jgi:hypothetical protein
MGNIHNTFLNEQENAAGNAAKLYFRKERRRGR